MEIFSTPVTYRNGDLTSGRNTVDATVALCLVSTRYFFDLPTKAKINRDAGAFSVSVHDRYHKNGLKTQYVRGKGIRIWNERTGKWVSRDLYWSAESTLKNLFNTSGKKFLYVVIEES